ncbi:PIN-like domain-containing protein [Brevibacterium spongiae]|uniref:PIN-like domain-containing protein n=1 Tax=Brevibacterium spongiae TaxID=2909672 RepID=A0ABY5SNG0_9MICO|nr:PIN-like domain-containing protein [Brevibacterium spongiae]UVI34728.1 PIN-like domain-containing protein [Brevibacterium spongiae]
MENRTSQTPLNIYSDFFEYRDRDLIDPDDPVNRTIYVIDTNVLLNLFKYSRSTARQVIEVLHHMRNALFLPHQVLEEFWPLLAEVRKGSHHLEAKGKVDTSMANARREVEKWFKRTGLEAIEESSQETGLKLTSGSDTQAGLSLEAVVASVENLLDEMEAASSRIGEIIDSVSEEAQENEILDSIEKIFEGRVGRAPDETEHKRLLTEFADRIDKGLPPGNRDVEIRKGETDKASGDFFIWRQGLNEAKHRSEELGQSVDLTLITNDLKDDWTRSTKPDPLPRRELVREFANATGGGVFRIKSFRHLIEVATSHFGAQSLDAAGMAQIEAVEDDNRGWTTDAAFNYLAYLYDRPRYHDQLKVLLAAYGAAKNGMDPITFSEARELTGRENLAQFSSPFRTILNNFEDDTVDEAMIWSRYPDNGEGVYCFNGNPLDALEKVLHEDKDFANIARSGFQDLCRLRNVATRDFDSSDASYRTRAEVNPAQ